MYLCCIVLYCNVLCCVYCLVLPEISVLVIDYWLLVKGLLVKGVYCVVLYCIVLYCIVLGFNQLQTLTGNPYR